jgi:hypothetical protein
LTAPDQGGLPGALALIAGGFLRVTGATDFSCNNLFYFDE